MDLGLAGRVVIVTGGSSGIGLACVTALIAEGAAVATCARDEERLEAAMAHLDPSTVLALGADVGDPDAMEAVVAATVARFGRLDGIAAVAGQGIPGRALEVSLAQWQEELLGKVSGVLNVVRAARPHLARSDAPRIVTLSAPTARDPDPADGRGQRRSCRHRQPDPVVGPGTGERRHHRQCGCGRSHRHPPPAGPPPPGGPGAAVCGVAAGRVGSAGHPSRPARASGGCGSPGGVRPLACLGYTTGAVFDATGGLPGR